MNKQTLMALLPLLLLAACKDEVPKVDDPHNIVVDGKPITQLAFVNKYCMETATNETCVKVRRAMLQDSTKGAVPRGW